MGHVLRKNGWKVVGGGREEGRSLFAKQKVLGTDFDIDSSFSVVERVPGSTTPLVGLFHSLDPTL